MKPVLTFLTMFLMLGGVASAEERYSDLLSLNKSTNPEATIELIDKLTLGFNLERGIIQDCENYLKVFKKKRNDKCNKVLSRAKSTNILFEILQSSEFRQNLTSLSKQLDQKSTNVISANELDIKLKVLMREQKQFFETSKVVNFLFKNM